jgi:RNA polymerase sigma-70 factor (ECF subfamily)
MATLVMPVPSIGSRAASERVSLDEALRRCASGDRSALRMIYDREAPRMLRVAMRLLGRPALAEEALHDAFVQIWRRQVASTPLEVEGGLGSISYCATRP